MDSLKDFANARQLVPCPATQTPKSTPRTSLSSSADGSFLSDTSPTKEEPSTPCASTPIAPRIGINRTDSPVLNTPSRLSDQADLSISNTPTPVLNQSVNNVVESSTDHSMSISHTKPLDQTKLGTPGPNQGLINNANPAYHPNVAGHSSVLQPTVNVNPTVDSTSVNQVFSVNVQQGIPRQNLPIVNNINPQAVTPRFIFMPNNPLGTPNANTSIGVNSSSVPRPITPSSRVQQVLFLTPAQLNNLRGQTPRFVYTTPKTIVFAPNRNGPPTLSTQNLPTAVPLSKEPLTQGDVVNKEAARPACSVNTDESAQSLVKQNAKPSEMCVGEIEEQGSTTDMDCTASTSSGQSKDEVEDSDETVDRNQSTLESTCGDEEVECTKHPLNAHQLPKSEGLENAETKSDVKNVRSVITEHKNDVEMRDVQFPESPDMFATPSPETEQSVTEPRNNDGLEHGLITATADATDVPKVRPIPNAESNPQESIRGEDPEDVEIAKTDGVEENQTHAPCKDIERASKDADGTEEKMDFEKENSTTRKKMRVDSKPSSISLRNTRQNSDIKEQEKKATIVSEIPDEIKPVRRNLRRTAPRQAAKTTRSTDNICDVKDESIATTNLCCKRCNAQVSQGNSWSSSS